MTLSVIPGCYLSDDEFVALYCRDGGPVVDALIERLSARNDALNDYRAKFGDLHVSCGVISPKRKARRHESNAEC